MNAYMEVYYLKKKSAQDYEKDFKALPRMARPQAKSLQKHVYVDKTEQRDHLFKKWEGYTIPQKAKNDRAITARKEREKKQRLEKAKYERAFKF